MKLDLKRMPPSGMANRMGYKLLIMVWVVAAHFCFYGCATTPTGDDHYSMGDKAYKARNYFEAVQHFQKAVELEPKEWAYWHFLANSYNSWGQYDKAITTYKKALEVGPSNAMYTHREMGWAFCRMRPLGFEEGIRHLNIAIASVTPKSPSMHLPYSHYYRGYCYFRQGVFEKAVVDMDYFLTYAKADQVDRIQKAYNIKAFSFLGLGDVDTALSIVKTKKEKYPSTDSEYFEALIHYTSGSGSNPKPVLKLKQGLKQGYLGIYIASEKSGQNSGVLVNAVARGGPAEKSGVLVGDQILAINDREVEHPINVIEAVSATPTGTTITMKILRNKAEKTLSVVVGSKMDKYNLELDTFTAPLLAHKEINPAAEDAAKRGDWRRAFDLYMEMGKEKPFDYRPMKRIIEIVKKLDPPPAVPDEAKKQAAIAALAGQDAEDDRSYDRAIAEFEKTLKWAPWVPSLHWNLALMHEARENYFQASLSLRLFKLASPDQSQDFSIDARIAQLQFKSEEKIRKTQGQLKEKQKLDKQKYAITLKQRKACVNQCYEQFSIWSLDLFVNSKRNACVEQCPMP